MDIDTEIAAANRRIQKRIDQMAAAARLRILAGTPTEIRDGIRKPQLEEIGDTITAITDAFVAAFTPIVTAVGDVFASIAELAETIAAAPEDPDCRDDWTKAN